MKEPPCAWELTHHYQVGARASGAGGASGCGPGSGRGGAGRCRFGPDALAEAGADQLLLGGAALEHLLVEGVEQVERQGTIDLRGGGRSCSR